MTIRKIKLKLLFPILLIGFLAAGCAPQAKIAVYTPAEISTKGIKKVAIGSFEIAEVYEKTKIERNGKWTTKQIKLTAAQKRAISNQIRVQVVNSLSSASYFDLVYTDEFARLNDDAALQQLIAAGGYKSKEVDAVINGKIWIDFEKTDGVDVAKAEMLYVQGGTPGENLNISVEKLLWWPFKNMRGTLILESKLTRLNPTEIVAITADSRSFSHKVGGKPKGLMENLGDATAAASKVASDQNKDNDEDAKENEVENSNEVLPSFEQVTSELATSIATNFVRRIAVTKKMRAYTIAQKGDPRGALLIEAGAYNKAIETLQNTVAQKENPEDLYNLGLAFEALGEIGTASNFYKKAFEYDKENLTYAQGIGRIERLLRERPTLRKQLASK